MSRRITMQRITSVSISLLLLVAFALPLVTSAQAANEDLRATIRAAILSDPRTAQMSEAEVESMVEALSAEAETQGVTSDDIVWRPAEPVQEPVPQEEATTCGSMPTFFCTLNEALGLDGSDIAIPIVLGITAALLLFVIGSILLHRHGHHPIAGQIGTTASAPAAPVVPAAPPPQEQVSPAAVHDTV